MSPKRIGRHLSGGPEPDDEGERESRESVREALSHWPSGVSIVAVREGSRVHALTVGAFIPVSLDPPEILVSLGPNAAAAPFLSPGVTFAVSLLAGDQRGLAARYADTFPVGPSPFPDEGPPTVRNALATLVCEVAEVIPRADHRLVIGRVAEATVGQDAPALVYHRRSYHAVGGGSGSEH